MNKKNAARRQQKRISKRAAHLKERDSEDQLVLDESPVLEMRGLEPSEFRMNVAGQSGDIEGLPERAIGDSESVMELVEEGQDLEAEVVSGVESAPDPDQAEVTIHERRPG